MSKRELQSASSSSSSKRVARSEDGTSRPHWSVDDVNTNELDSVLYNALDLPGAGRDVLGAASSSAIPDTVGGMIATLLNSESAMRSAQGKLEGKRMMLDNTVRDPLSGASEQRRKARFAKSKVMSTRQQKKQGMIDIDHSTIRYDMFLPIHQLWLQYFHQATNGTNSCQVLQGKLGKTDLHGAIITVIRSRCPSLIGQHGIVFLETQYTFEIVLIDNSTKVIPKEHSVFGVTVQGVLLQIFGNNIRYRPSERSAKNYKPCSIRL